MGEDFECKCHIESSRRQIERAKTAAKNVAFETRRLASLMAASATSTPVTSSHSTNFSQSQPFRI
jgi:hypothetical protein